MVKNMERVHISTKMEINLQEIGLEIEKMDMECSNMPMALSMMGSGLMIELRTKAKLHMLIKTNTKAFS